ncbi:MAG: DUF6029 family protein [Bacteroidota bacterium]|nr:DUF6029 family protein [Bacteroidota bacterium]
MKKLSHIALAGLGFLSFFSVSVQGQDFIKNAEIHGNFQADGQYYMNDSKMGITDSTLDGKVARLNGFTSVNYSYGDFSAGLRFESYLPPLLGYDAQYDGSGIPYYYLDYKTDLIQVTAGNFYEQFGNGMVLRTYQNWNLGYDNSLKGLRVRLTPCKGVTIKGVYGYQRYYWNQYQDNNRGIVKGADAEFYLNDIFKNLADKKTRIIVGGSFVSDYQKGKTLDYIYNSKVLQLNLPENIAAMAGRLNLTSGKFDFYSEYAYKINDPSAMNHYIYKNGQGLYSSLSFSQKGLGIMVAGKYLDNMSYKSKRSITTNGLDINYLPPVTLEHDYALASMYPYATQPNGEAGFQGQLTFTVPKNTVLGGKTGWNVALNYAQVNSINKETVNDTIVLDQPGTKGYKADFFSIGKDIYYQDLNLEVTKRFGKKAKGIFSYLYQTYNKDIIEGHINEYPDVHAQIGVIDMAHYLTRKHTLRWELQGLFTSQDKGNWVAGLVEFTIAPKWFMSVQDQWNYGNSDKDQQLHYYLVNAGFNYHSTRVSLSWGRQREGILCVGGVCRYVPASSGISLSVSTSF